MVGVKTSIASHKLSAGTKADHHFNSLGRPPLSLPAYELTATDHNVALAHKLPTCSSETMVTNTSNKRHGSSSCWTQVALKQLWRCRWGQGSWSLVVDRVYWVFSLPCIHQLVSSQTRSSSQRCRLGRQGINFLNDSILLL